MATHQRGAESSKAIIPGLTWRDNPDNDFGGAKSAANYLSQLKLHMLELAKGGCALRGVNTMELCKHGSVITAFLEVPYDCVVRRYHARATRSAALVVSEERLTWL